MNTEDLKSFCFLENGEIFFSQYSTEKVSSKLWPGNYNLNYISYPNNRFELKQNPDSESSKIFDFPEKPMLDHLLTTFFDPEIKKQMNDLQFNHKLGLLFYGKEGTGKTTIMKHYFTIAIEKFDAIVFQIQNVRSEDIRKCWEMIEKIRLIQDNPIIILLDEFDIYMKNSSGFMKTIMDGDRSIDNCIFFAATNSIGSIPVALRNRQSRFKYVIEVRGIATFEGVKEVIVGLLGDRLEEIAIEELANVLIGEPLDVIKQKCIDHIMNVTHDAATKSTIGY